MSPQPFPTTAPLLGPITEWCIDTFDGLTPLLIGVEFGAEHVGFHPVELDPIDPLSDTVGLVADPEWDVAVLLVDVLHAIDNTETVTTRSGLLAHGHDRDGLFVTILDSPDGSRRMLRQTRGVLHDAIAELFL